MLMNDDPKITPLPFKLLFVASVVSFANHFSLVTVYPVSFSIFFYLAYLFSFVFLVFAVYGS